MTVRDVRDCVTEGGIPTEFTRANLVWLAQAHRALARSISTYSGAGFERAQWHLRWAALVESILEDHHDHS